MKRKIRFRMRWNDSQPSDDFLFAICPENMVGDLGAYRKMNDLMPRDEYGTPWWPIVGRRVP